MNHKNIIGRNFRFVYSDETYLIEVLSASAVRWTREIGKNAGKSATEQYVFSSLADNIVMLTWIEADGLGLSNVMRFDDNVLATHANVGRNVFVNSGKLTGI